MSLAREHLKILQATKEVKIAIKESVDIMGVEALNHFTKSFRNQGFEDNGVTPWKKRKGDRLGWSSGRAILVKSGALRRSLFKYRSGVSQVTIKSQLPYANVHNEGGLIHKDFNRKILSFNRDGKFTKTRTRKQRNAISHQQQVTIDEHDIVMPKRQFVGHSNKLIEKLYKRIDRKILNVWK